jgi:Undecaprenyl-phosphate galactose phosphotransferase WbaP
MFNSHVLMPVSAFRSTVAVFTCGILLALADALAWLAIYLVVWPPQKAAIKFVIMAAAWCAWTIFARNQYARRHSFWTELGLILQGILMLVFVGSMLKVIIGDVDSLLTWLFACLLLALVLPLLRWLARWALRYIGLWNYPTLIFGGAVNALQASLALRNEAAMGYEVLGVFQPDYAVSEVDAMAFGCPLFHWPKVAKDFECLRGYHCVIALDAHEFDLRDKLIRQLSQYQVGPVHVIPAMRGVPLFGLQTTEFFSHELLMIHVRNNLMNPLHRFTKRVFDLIGALVLIVALSPLMLWVVYKIWRSDGTPVIFSQPRLGKGLKTFSFYKFRSMVNDAESVINDWESTNSPEWQEYTSNNFKLANDPRLIGIGAMIRRTSVDELPQLFNVIKGEMSLVGPRPLLPREKGNYGDDLSLYALTPPGLTGLWQVSGRSQTTFDDRVAFDSWYVKNWSIWLDITILFKTCSVVFRRNGAY